MQNTRNVFIIAEAGVNHNGDVGIAKEMIRAAKNAGVDCIKFQTFKSENLVSYNAPKAEYQIGSTKNQESQLEMLKKLELSENDFKELKCVCQEEDITFLSTPFDLDSIDFLQQLGIKLWKIPSGEITNLPYLIKIARTGLPVIMSTGMSIIEEIEQAIAVLKQYGCNELTLLHCNTEYPTPFEDANLKAMSTLKEHFNCEVGYSDHTEGITVPLGAVALGARVIEKHFTLDKNMNGPDHKASIDTNELALMVKSIRIMEKALGDGVKLPSKSEQKNINIARKSIVAKKNIMKGEIFTEENLAVKRPGDGLSPMLWFDVIGKAANKDYHEDEVISI